MKILVTGGVGFIGRNLIERLVKEGHEIISIDNYLVGTESNQIEGVTYLRFDIRDILSFTETGFDMCYHFAAYSRIQPSFKMPLEVFEVNSKGTLLMAEWAKINNVRFIHASSSSRWKNPMGSPYACFKHIGEEILEMYKRVYNLNVEVCRFYNVYGPHEILGTDAAAIIGKWRNAVAENKPLTIVGDGNQRRDFTHVYDVVDGLYRIGMSDKIYNRTWEFGTGRNYSINEVFSFFKERYPSITCEYIPERPGEYDETLRQNDDALEMIGWRPKDRMREYVLSL